MTAVDEPAGLETATVGHSLIDLDVGYTVHSVTREELRLFARDSSLADQEARRHASFVRDSAPSPGAGALVGFKAHF